MIQPTFLICSERSGSNLIRAMLDAHSTIFAPMPLNLGRDIWYHLHRYGDLRRDENWRALVRDVVRRFRRYPSDLGFSLEEQEIHGQVTERSFGKIYEYIYSRGMSAAGKSCIFLKENHVGQQLFLYLEAFPEARFVFQVREPRDYLLSCRRVSNVDPFYRSDAACLAVWRADQLAGLNALFSLGSERVFVQRYEDLVQDAESVLRPLCDFLHVPYEESMLHYHERQTSRKAATGMPKFWQNLSRPVMKDNHGKYRQGLGSLAVKMVEQRVGDVMTQFGYQPDYGPPRAGGRMTVKAYELYRKIWSDLRPMPKRRDGAAQPRPAGAGDPDPPPLRADPRVVFPYAVGREVLIA